MSRHHNNEQRRLLNRIDKSKTTDPLMIAARDQLNRARNNEQRHAAALVVAKLWKDGHK